MSDLLSLLQDFDVANFLPAPDKYLLSLVGWVRLIMLAGPLVLFAMGLWHRFVAPKKPGSKLGFPLWVPIGSKKAWDCPETLRYGVFTAGRRIVGFHVCRQSVFQQEARSCNDQYCACLRDR